MDAGTTDKLGDLSLLFVNAGDLEDRFDDAFGIICQKIGFVPARKLSDMTRIGCKPALSIAKADPKDRYMSVFLWTPLGVCSLDLTPRIDVRVRKKNN